MNDEIKSRLEIISILLACILAVLMVVSLIFVVEITEIREQVKMLTTHQLRSKR